MGKTDDTKGTVGGRITLNGGRRRSDYLMKGGVDSGEWGKLVDIRLSGDRVSA